MKGDLPGHPDEIGSSEYRAIYDCLESGLETCDADARLNLAEAILEAFLEHASAMLDQVGEPRGETQGPQGTADEEPVFVLNVPAEAAQQIVAGICAYMFEKDSRWQWRELSGADFVEFVTLLLSRHDLVPEDCADGMNHSATQ